MSASWSSPRRAGRDRLVLGDPVGQLPAEEAGEDQVGGVPEQPRAERHQRDAADREQHDGDRLASRSGAIRPQQPLGRRAEVHRLLADHAAAHRAAAGTGPLATTRSVSFIGPRGLG